jgi:hypothetical protein
VKFEVVLESGSYRDNAGLGYRIQWRALRTLGDFNCRPPSLETLSRGAIDDLKDGLMMNIRHREKL